MKKIILSAFVALTLFSCNKADKVNNQSPQSLITKALKLEGESDGEIMLVNNITQTKYGTLASDFSFQGNLGLSPNYTNIQFNTYPVSITDNQFYASSTIDTPTLKGRESEYFGTSNTVSLDGSSLANSMFIPKPIVLQFPGNEYSITKSAGIDLTWEVQAENTNPVVIVLAGSSEGLPEGGIVPTKVLQFSHQSGHAHINPDELTDFNAGEYIMVYAGTGNEEYFDLNAKSYSILGLCVTYVPKVLVN